MNGRVLLRNNTKKRRRSCAFNILFFESVLEIHRYFPEIFPAFDGHRKEARVIEFILSFFS